MKKAAKGQRLSFRNNYLALILLLFSFSSVTGQTYTPMTAAGYMFKRVMADSTLHIPNFCGVPTLRDVTTNKSAVGADTCNNLLYWYNGKTKVWSVFGSGSGGSVVNILNDSTILICNSNACDTFSVTNSINNFHILNDSTITVCDAANVCDTINIGPTTFLFSDTTLIINQIDSIVNAVIRDSARNLQQVTDIGNTTTNPMVSSNAMVISNASGNISMNTIPGSPALTWTLPYLGNSTNLRADSADNRNLQLPNADGYLATTVNGIPADVTGNIVTHFTDTAFVQSLIHDSITTVLIGPDTTFLIRPLRALNDSTEYLDTFYMPQLRYINATRDTTLWTDSTLVDRQYLRDRISATPGLNAVMAVDSTTTHQLLSTNKFKNNDSLIVNDAYVRNGLVIGDSIKVQTDSVFYWGNSVDLNPGYTVVTSTKLRTIEVNKAISGTTMQRITAGDSSFIDRLYTVPNYRSTMRYISIGNYAQNDCNLSGGVAGYITALNKALDTLIIARGYPARKILVMTPSLGWNTALGKKYDSMLLYTNATISIAKAKGVILIDVFNYMLNNGGRGVLIASDSIHPNAAGFSAIANVFDLSTGSAHIYGSLYAGRNATVMGKMSIGTNEYADDINANGAFKIKQGSNFFNFNGSTSTAFLDLSNGTPGNYLRMFSDGTNGSSIFQQGSANQLNISAGGGSYIMLAGGSHTISAPGTYSLSTGVQNITLTGTHTATSSEAVNQYNFFTNSTNTIFRMRVGTGGSKLMYFVQEGTSHDFINSALGDMGIKAYSPDSSQKFLLASGTGIPSIVIQSNGHGTNIGGDTTNVLSSWLTVSGWPGMAPKGSIPAPRLTTLQRQSITSGVYTGTRVGGSGYTNQVATNMALTGGTGTGATAYLTIAGGIVTVVTMTYPGQNYTVGDVLSASGIGAGSGFTYTVTALTTAAEGLQVYDLTLHKLYVWDATAWQAAW